MTSRSDDDDRSRMAAQLTALRERQAFMAEAESIVGVGSYMLRPDQPPVWSDGLFRILGYEPGSVEPGTEAFYARMHPDDHERVLRMRQALFTGELAALEYRILRADTGEVRYLRGVVRPSGSPAPGQSQCYVGAVLDITERVQLEEQLRHAAKMEAVGTLAAGVAHDFNNYMMVIAGTMDLLAQPGLGEAPTSELMKHARHAVTRCMDLTQQLLAFGRRQPSHDEVVELGDALQRIGALLSPTLGRHVRLELFPPPKPVWARIDSAHLEQVLANLAINARDAIAERGGDGGRIVIRVETVRSSAPSVLIPAEVPAGSWSVIEVSDDGVGIAEQHLPRIFDPYFTTKAMGRGTGLGLSSVYGTVVQHGGYLTVSSRLGEGTTFSVWLPAEGAAASTSQPAVEPAQPAAATHRVLVVDDLVAVRHVTALTLQAAGYEVVEAADGLEALEHLQAQDFDLVLSDVRMPRMDGLQLASLLRERRPALPVILMTGFAERPSDAQPFPVLDKPFSAERLITEVRRRLE